MQVLDIDLDYFLDSPVSGDEISEEERVTSPECIRSVWSESRVRTYFEKQLGLLKDKKIKGRVFKGHDEALYFWEELIDRALLVPPFSVVHIDSHPDLGYRELAKCVVLEDIIFRPIEYRKPRYCKNCDIDGHYCNIGIGNYLLYGIGFRWFSKIDFCANPNCDYGAIPSDIILGEIPDKLLKSETFQICLSKKASGYSNEAKTKEPCIPLRIIPTFEEVNYNGDFDFISIAQSPNYTPENADYIIEIIKEYIELI